MLYLLELGAKLEIKYIEIGLLKDYELQLRVSRKDKENSSVYLYAKGLKWTSLCNLFVVREPSDCSINSFL